jgi:serine/threonine protein kinase
LALATGTRLGPYEILSTLGVGGMGEVYEAEDTRLKRRVALKVLQPAIASDPVRRARFEKEARAVASLNHPNIVTIHSVEEYDDTRFLTMEIVDGRTIDRLVPPAGLPLEQLLTYAIPLVEAVGAAHARHIVHRDLKPGNVMVTGDGRVKVLDFGLAKLLDPPVLDGSLQTVTAAPATMAGQIVGTAAYMSPEQAEGRPVDYRSDIFSIGVLLYEMATGLRPFRGDTGISILSSIIKDEPKPMTRLRPGASRDLERIVSQCLAKDPAKRPSSASELRTRLASLIEAPVPRSRRLRGGAILAVAVLLLGLAAAYVGPTWPFRARAIVLPKLAFVRLTDDRGIESWPSLSPDSREIVYAGRRPTGSGIRQLTHRATVLNDPVPSRDGRWVGGSNPNSGEQFIFDAHDWTKLADRLPSPPTRSPVYLRDWSPDGSRIAGADTSGVLWVFDVAAKSWDRIGAGSWPRWLPDGRRLVVTSRARVMLVDTTTRAAREIYQEPARRIGTAVLAPDGRRLYFTSAAIESDIWTMRFSR